MTMFMFGMGYAAQASAAAFSAPKRDPIAGTRRTAEGAAQLAALGYDGHVFDGHSPGHTLGPALRRSRLVVLSIAPDESGDPALRLHRGDMDAAFELDWLCYFSTIGVYGDRGGGWVDEAGTTDSSTARARRRVKAEQAWRDYARQRGVKLCVLRLAGIYGPGRSMFDKLAKGTARRVIKPGQVFNRIHVADIARITALAAEHRLEGIFNLADDEPAPPQDVISHAAELAGVDLPPDIAFEQARFTDLQRSFYADNKRVANQAIKSALGIELIYPTYRDGLGAISGTLR